MTKRLDCEVLAGCHSDDHITVWYGNLLPMQMCGKHAEAWMESPATLGVEMKKRMEAYRASWTPETGWKEPYS